MARDLLQLTAEVDVKVIGIVLIVVGVLMLAVGGIRYTTREKVVDVGPIHATADKEHDIPLSPIAGGGALIAGIVLVVAGSRSRV